MYFCIINLCVMECEYDMKESNMQKVGEPELVYGIATKARVFSEEELSHGITVEESRRRITELIYNHYHHQG